MTQARFIRQREAPAYLGMDRNRFDAEVRPGLTEVPIGERGIAFDRLELDEWADAYIAARGRPGRTRKGEHQCEPGQRASSSPTTAAGVSTSSIEGNWGDDEGNYYVHQPAGFMALSNLERLTAPAPAAPAGEQG